VSELRATERRKLGSLVDGDKKFIEDAVADVVRKWALMLLSAVATQVFVGVWWAASINHNVNVQDERLRRVEGSYVSSAAVGKDFALRDQRLSALDSITGEIRAEVQGVRISQDRVAGNLSEMTASLRALTTEVKLGGEGRGELREAVEKLTDRVNGSSGK